MWPRYRIVSKTFKSRKQTSQSCVRLFFFEDPVCESPGFSMIRSLQCSSDGLDPAQAITNGGVIWYCWKAATCAQEERDYSNLSRLHPSIHELWLHEM
jgi:hypothetical protein